MTYTKEEIEKDLLTEKVEYYVVDTCLGQNEDRWRRGEKSKFQQNLCNLGLEYFAYIKFYLEGYNKIAIVVGKSGSKLVNKSQGCDLSFSVKATDGAARKWLLNNQRQWCQTKILVVPAKCQREAYAIESELAGRYSLLGS